MSALWQREAYEPGSGEIEFELWCYATEPVPLDRGTPVNEPWCPYSEIPAWLDIGVIKRSDIPDAFERLLNRGRDTIRDTAAADALFPNLAYLYKVELKLEDVPDLGYLQTAWAVARWLVRNGADAIFDDTARTWHFPAELPETFEFDIRHETKIILESDADPGRGQMMHTRGMRKFARPDLLVELRPGRGPMASRIQQTNEVFTSLSKALALGRRLSPGTPVTFADDVFDVAAYQPGVNAPDVSLENEGLLLERRATRPLVTTP